MDWREFTGRWASERSQRRLLRKFPHERGLSRATMAAVEAGELVIIPDVDEDEDGIALPSP